MELHLIKAKRKRTMKKTEVTYSTESGDRFTTEILTHVGVNTEDDLTAIENHLSREEREGIKIESIGENIEITDDETVFNFRGNKKYGS